LEQDRHRPAADRLPLIRAKTFTSAQPLVTPPEMVRINPSSLANRTST
jgi:hypothetical protein